MLKKKIQKIIDVLDTDFLALAIFHFYAGHTSLTKHSSSHSHNAILLLEGLHWTGSKLEAQLNQGLGASDRSSCYLRAVVVLKY